MSSRRLWLLPTVAFLIPMSLGGCDNKISQCNRLIDVINKEQGPLKNAKGNDSEALNKLATTLDTVSVKVTSVQLKDEKLIAFRIEYARMATELARHARETATAIEASDLKKATESNKALQATGNLEGPLVDQINKYCSGS